MNKNFKEISMKKEYKATAEFIRQSGSVSETAIVTCKIVPATNEDFSDNEFHILNLDYLKPNIVELVNSKISN